MEKQKTYPYRESRWLYLITLLLIIGSYITPTNADNNWVIFCFFILVIILNESKPKREAKA